MSSGLFPRLSHFLRSRFGDGSYALTLLPISNVLFPGGRMQLKTRDPRFVTAARASIDAGRPLGLALALPGTQVSAHIGCEVAVERVESPTSEDLTLAVRGVRRFHIETRSPQDDPGMFALVQPLSEEQPVPVPARHAACATTLRHIVASRGEDQFAPPLRFDDAVWVGYRLAETLPIKLSARQDMLEMNDTLTRLEILHRFLAQQGLQG